jgi:hypothetical protein
MNIQIFCQGGDWPLSEFIYIYYVSHRFEGYYLDLLKRFNLRCKIFVLSSWNASMPDVVGIGGCRFANGF